MRRAAMLAVAALGAWFVDAAPAGAANFEANRIVVIVKATTAQYWAAVFAGADAAARVLGVQLSKLGPNAETDAAGQASMMENSIASKPTAIVIAATNAQALAAPIAKATDSGIPVIVIDSGADTDKYVTFLATNNVVAGANAADEMAACIKARTGKQEGSIATMTALAGAQSLNDRDAGFVEALKKYSGLQIVEHRVGNNDPSRALSDAEDILARRPDLVGLFADNELEGDGAGTAIEEKGLGNKICAVAFDTSDQEVNFVRKGVLDALIVQNPFMMGYAGVWYGLAAANGVVLPHYVNSGAHVLTKGNMASSEMAGLLDPKKYAIKPFLRE